MAGFAFIGKPHSGLDDSINIARLAVRLLEDGCKFLVNEKLYCEKLNRNLKAFRGTGTVESVTRKQAEVLPSSDEEEEEESDGEVEHCEQ